KYITPLLDALAEIGVDERFALYRENNPPIVNNETWITAMSHVFLRGTNIKDSTLIIDESQNLTRGESKKVLTRVHNSTKVIMIVHTGQIDLQKTSTSEFAPYIDRYRDETYAKVCKLTVNVREKLASKADK